jgi:hypothetical protein
MNEVHSNVRRLGPKSVLHSVNYQEELPLNAFETVSRGYFYFEIPYSDLTTLTILRSPPPPTRDTIQIQTYFMLRHF